jgi:molybdopterin synthase catalytic subunit
LVSKLKNIRDAGFSREVKEGHRPLSLSYSSPFDKRGTNNMTGVKLIQITDVPISPEQVISLVRTPASGCVVTYVGLIRDNSHGKKVISVEYKDTDGRAVDGLREIAGEIKKKWPVNQVAICHRVGRLEVGEINFVVAISAGHREEGFAAIQYAVDCFKEKLPTAKRETYRDGSVWAGD